MRFYSLRQPVTQTGKTLYGFGNSSVTFRPGGAVTGFAPLFFKEGKNRIPLDLGVVSIGNRRIEANFLGHSIKAAEHYAALRFLFPDLTMASASAELPHFSTTGPIAERLIRHAAVVNVNVPWYTVADRSGWGYPKHRGGLSAYTFIEPNTDRKLRIEVTVSYDRFGKPLTRTFVFPDEGLLRKVMAAKPLGIPHWLEHPAKALWVHAEDAYWPKNGERDVLEKIILHRVLDILGALALLESPVKGGFPSLNVYSQCSGHFADLKALEGIQTVPLSE